MKFRKGYFYWVRRGLVFLDECRCYFFSRTDKLQFFIWFRLLTIHICCTTFVPCTHSGISPCTPQCVPSTTSTTTPKWCSQSSLYTSFVSLSFTKFLNSPTLCFYPFPRFSTIKVRLILGTLERFARSEFRRWVHRAISSVFDSVQSRLSKFEWQ